MEPIPAHSAQPSLQGAHCAVHAEAEARMACARCGNFMCAECTGPGVASRCPNCRVQLSRFPLSREDWHPAALWNVVLAAYKPNWLMLCVAFIVYIAVYFALTIGVTLLTVMFVAVGGAGGGGEVFALVATVLSHLAQAAVVAMLSLGFLRIGVDVLQGRGVEVGRLFGEFGRAGLMAKLFGTFLPIMLVAGGGLAAVMIVTESPALALGLFAVVIPVIFVLGVGLMFMMVGFVVHPQMGFVDHLRRVQAMMRGQIMNTLGVLFLGWLVTMAGALACGIGMIPAYGFYMLLQVGLYLTLERDSAFDVRPGGIQLGGLGSIR